MLYACMLCLCSSFIYFAFDSSELIIFGLLIFIFAYISVHI